MSRAFLSAAAAAQAWLKISPSVIAVEPELGDQFADGQRRHVADGKATGYTFTNLR